MSFAILNSRFKQKFGVLPQRVFVSLFKTLKLSTHSTTPSQDHEEISSPELIEEEKPEDTKKKNRRVAKILNPCPVKECHNLQQVFIDEVKKYHVSTDQSPVIIEPYPGECIIAEALLQHGMTVRLIEPTDECDVQMNALKLSYGDERLRTYKLRRLDIFNKSNKPLFKDIKTSWSDEDPPTVLLTTLIDQNDIVALIVASIRNFSNETSIYQFGFSHMLLCFPENAVAHLTTEESLPVRTYIMLFRTLFNCTVLHKISCHVPNNSEETNIDMCLVCVVPKKEFLNTLGSFEKVRQYIHFIKHLFRQYKKKPIIMVLEEWIPKCGPEFIHSGINLYDSVTDFEYESLLDVFLKFTSLPSFSRSIFNEQMKQKKINVAERKRKDAAGKTTN